jgi:hypothetical protein
LLSCAAKVRRVARSGHHKIKKLAATREERA